jgi:hypothetical protein
MKKKLILAGICFLFLCSSIEAFSPLFTDDQNVILLHKDQEYYKQSTTLTIYNPYEDVDFGIVHHYKANLHTHTTESDGVNTPSEVIFHYHDVGQYDILAITDHNKNTWSWSNWIDATPSNPSKSSEYYSTLEMLAISGNEMSSGHHRCSLMNDYPAGGLFIHVAFWYIQHQKGVAFFAHPGRYQYNANWYHRFFNKYTDCVLGLEVYNQGDRYPNDRILWDDINKNREPGDLIWGFSNDDLHKISSHAFRNYQHFLMDHLTEQHFRDAIVNGAFYFSYEPNGSRSNSQTYGTAMTPTLLDVTVTGNIITITSGNLTHIEWYDQDTTLIGTDVAIDATQIESKFVRAVLINEYGRTYTQPFGIKRA